MSKRATTRSSPSSIRCAGPTVHFLQPNSNRSARSCPANAPIDIVAVAANPLHQSLANVRHFIKIHYLSDVKNFYFVTGPTAKTKPVWKSYGIAVTNEPG